MTGDLIYSEELLSPKTQALCVGPAALMRLGGAGIHFMFIEHCYRVSFNFLEHSRVVLALKRKAGPARDVSFSTQQPDRVIQLVQNAVAAKSDESSHPTFGG